VKKKNNKEKYYFIYNQGLFFVFVGMFIFFTIVSPYFFTVSNIFSVLRQASVLFLLASGQSLVVITGGIDLSHGSLIGLCSTLIGLALLNYGVLEGILVGLLMGLISGIICGILIGWRKLEPFIVTLGMMYVLEGITLIITGGKPVFGIEDNVLKIFCILGRGYFFKIIPVPVIILFIFILIMFVILHKLKYGRHLFAVGGNEIAARLSGINITLTKIIAYSVDGILVGIAAIILTARAGSGQPLMGGGMLMESIGAVVVGGISLKGGRGNLFQAVLGVFFMAFMVNGLDILGISTFVKQLLIGCIIIGGVFTRLRENN
jgi:ribose transport system permease protein